jgi:hypothetical protein
LARTAEDALKKLIKDCWVLQQQFICLRGEAPKKKQKREQKKHACMTLFKGCWLAGPPKDFNDC